MFIDFLFFILLVVAVLKGYGRGLIVAVFSLLAFFIGLLAAVKFSATVARWLEDQTGTHSTWMPFIAFVLVMAGVMLVIKLGANMLQRATEFVMLGWVNRLGGILFYGLIYLLYFSIVLFYAENLGLLTEETIASSKTYGFVAPWGPWAIDGIGTIIPVFRGLFDQLETFFDNAGRQIE